MADGLERLLEEPAQLQVRARVAEGRSRGGPSGFYVGPGAVSPPSALPLPRVRNPTPLFLSPPGTPVPGAAGGIHGRVAEKTAKEFYRTRGVIADRDAARLQPGKEHAKERVSSMATDGNGEGGDENYRSSQVSPSPVLQQEKNKEDDVLDDYEYVDERRGPIANFPAGYHFQPTDEEIILKYLRPEISKRELPFQVFHHVDFSKYHPEELVERYRDYGEDKWFFFHARERKHPNGSRPNRKTKYGYWKATGSEKPITVKQVIDGKLHEVRIGLKKSLVFYQGSSGNGKKTDWIMHEYENYNDESNTSHAKINELVVATLERKKGSTQKRKGEGVSPLPSPPPLRSKCRRLSDAEVTNEAAMAQFPGEFLQGGDGQVAGSTGELQGWNSRVPYSAPVRSLQNYRPSSGSMQFAQPTPRPSSGSLQLPRPSPHPSSGSLPFLEPSSHPSFDSLQFPQPSPHPSSGSMPFPEPSPHPSSGSLPFLEPSSHPSSDSLQFPQPSPHPSSGSMPFPEPSPLPSSCTLQYFPQPSPHPSSDSLQFLQPNPHPSSDAQQFPQSSPHPSSSSSRQFCPSGHGASQLLYSSAFTQGVYKSPYNYQATSSHFDQQDWPPGEFWT